LRETSVPHAIAGDATTSEAGRGGNGSDQSHIRSTTIAPALKLEASSREQAVARGYRSAAEGTAASSLAVIKELRTSARGSHGVTP